MVKLCRTFLAEGKCNDPGCTLDHNPLTCEPCGFVALSKGAYDGHMGGKTHRSRVEGKSLQLSCPICDTSMDGYSWEQHCNGSRHQKNLKLKQVTGNVEPTRILVAERKGQHYCDLCQTFVPESAWGRHLKTKRHAACQRFASYRVLLDELEKDKNGVTIEGNFDFDIVEVVDASKGMELALRISTSVPSAKVSLVEVKWASNHGRAPDANSPFAIFSVGTNQTLSYKKPLTLKSTFRQRHIGRYEDRAEFVFEDLQLANRFTISRTLRAIVGSKADHELLKPKMPYTPPDRTERTEEKEVIAGPPPTSTNTIPYVVVLQRAPIPRGLLSVLSTGNTMDVMKRLRNAYFPEKFDADTYARRFKALLWVEEYQMDTDLQRYDRRNVRLKTHGGFYHLNVPGLAEKRPSVLKGDLIHVQRHGETNGRWFEGHVHFVHKDAVGLRFHGSFPWSPSNGYDIRYKLNRIPVRRQHQAMDTAFSQQRILFPTERPSGTPLQPERSGVKVFNPLIATNAPQMQAVVSIVKMPPGSLPFVIFGPPGTGKTVTMVEAIRQVLVANPKAKVLACAPSNSAADLLASRLIMLGKEVLFRFYAPSRDKRQIPDELEPFTFTRDGHFSMPILAKVKSFRVVVTTCISASFAYGVGIPRGHFSHIFMDEAGQATEPESFVSIKTMADTKTNVVLSGDPQQLGPIIRSKVAKKLGLDVSYLERLMSRDCYDTRGGYGLSVVKLIKNFRSHPAILRFPNEQFYNGELRPFADSKVMNYFLGSSYLPNPKFPVVFHAVSGKDMREASSPSFFNIEEATLVKDYVTRLRDDRRFRTSEKDIAVVTPYHAQCQKIRTILNMEGVKVGSVEELQGQERSVIIISTVRSTKEFVGYDLHHTLGFVANPRRFNVAVTRAKSLLIVIGDPAVLSLDRLWKSFLNYIHINGGWKGPAIPWDPNGPVDEGVGGKKGSRGRSHAPFDMEELAREMEEMALQSVRVPGEDANVGGVDMPWRDLE